MPGIRSFFRRYNQEIFVRKQKVQSKSTKLNISTLFVQKQKPVKKANNNYIQNCSQRRKQQFQNILNSQIIDLEKLRKLSWHGIPQEYRSKVWKVLLKYTSTNKDNHEHFLKTKRGDYFNLVESYMDDLDVQFDDHEKKIFYKLIHADVIRTVPQSPLFRQQKVQQMLERILYVWHIRHPSSGYVQGLNDIVTPFLIVFLSDFIEIDLRNVQITTELSNVDQEMLSNVQADCYWCFTKIMNQILDNYTNSWPGIQKSFQNIKDILNRVDSQLLQHVQSKGIDFYNIYFKWVTCLLLRQFSTKISLRLFDTFISFEAAEGTFFKTIQFIFVAIFLKYSKKLKKLNFQELMTFQHKMPTKTWDQEQISTIIAESFVYQNYFSS